MLWLLACFFVCVTFAVCILGTKYLDKKDDISYTRCNEFDRKLRDIRDELKEISKKIG